jgi:hypothetical protein
VRAKDATDYPFGLWFANPTTAGLQKGWSSSSTDEWQLDYIPQNGLDLRTACRFIPDSMGGTAPTDGRAHPALTLIPSAQTSRTPGCDE